MTTRTVFRWMLAGLFANISGAAASGQTEPSGGGLPKAEIEKLVAPIALYPDVLISQILPAATFPTDVVQAARWCKEHADLKGLDEQTWDLSVISVCRYPQVLDKMNADLDWTNALGAAFLDQPNDVMAAIQELREQAKTAGVLQTTPQQTVVVEEETIRIVPTEKEVVYVPQYDPQVIYVDADDDDDDGDGLVVAGTIAAGALSFGAGMAMGAWLDNDCDWHGGCVVGCRPGYWGGWGYRGAVAWDNDWAAARGPRRGVVAGEHGGAYVGPRGAAVWGENGHGAAWRRPTSYGTPSYSGRYANYNNVAGNRRNVVAGNEVNINRNNVNIDRGDRTAVRGGDRTNVGGDRTNVAGGDRANVAGGDRANVGGGDRARPGEGNRPNVGGGDRPNPGGNRPNVGGADRPNAGGANRPNPPSANRPEARPQKQSSARPSSVGDNRSSSQVQKSSNRGSSSRGQGGGGGRGGGGGGGGRGGGRR